MRISVIEPDGTGGMLHFAQMLASALATKNHEVVLFTARDYELADLPREFEVRAEFALWSRLEPRDAGGRDSWWRRIYVGLIRRAARAGRLFLEMWRAVNDVVATSPDVILVRPYPLPGHALILWRLKRSGAALVEITHEFQPRDTVHSLVARIETWLSGADSKQVDARLFMGEEVRAQYSRLYPHYPTERMELIPHGDGELFRKMASRHVDLRARYGLTEDDRVALFFGNLRPSKGLETLLRAFALADRAPGSKLLIIGHPSRDFDRGALQSLVGDLGISSSVVIDMSYLPNDEVGPLYELARFLVLPYESATQSGPLHIAMTYLKPVLATTAGGIRDVIEDGRTGLLVEPGDIYALAGALERLLEDDALLADMADAIVERLPAHDWSVVADGVLAAASRAGRGAG